MIGIKEIAVYIPDAVRDNIMLAQQFGEDETYVRKRIGALTLPIKAEGQDTSDLASEAVRKLLEKTGLDVGDIQCLVVCTQNPDGCGLPHTSAIVQEKCGLPNSVAAFDISLGCSGFVYGLFTIRGFMEAAGLSRGIFVTADPYSKIVDPQDKSTSLLFGDAATATLITTDPQFSIRCGSFGTDGAGAPHLVSRNGKLHMNGRQIFNFAASRVPAQIRALLSQQSLDVDDIDLFVLHQGSRYVVDTLKTRMGLPSEKVPVQLEHTGNTVSSSIPIILEQVLGDESRQRILVSGFGVGLSWATAILERVK